MPSLLAGKKILVVDDVAAERMMIAEFLQQQGCKVYQAFDGMDGIEKAPILLPDLILMDTQMPRCDGYHACRLLTSDERTAAIPIIFLSGLATPEQRIQGLLAGAVDYIGKPFDFNEVRLRLLIHLRKCTPTNAFTATRDSPASEANINRLLFSSARVHLLKCLAEPPDIHTLARLVGTNTKRLYAAFKACTGGTIFEYLREVRMQEARLLLKETEMSIQEIGLQLGFSSGANFATAFKERYGLSPTSFRFGMISDAD